MANRYTDPAFAAKGLKGTEKSVLWVLYGEVGVIAHSNSAALQAWRGER